jgi:hypothetical protein
MFDVLLDVYDNQYLSIATSGVALAFTRLATLAPARGAILRRRDRSVSPLWLLAPAVVAAGLLSLGRSELLAVTAGGNTLPAMFVVQVAVSGWVLWRNRDFPWLVVFAVVALGWIQWSFFMAAQGAGRFIRG